MIRLRQNSQVVIDKDIVRREELAILHDLEQIEAKMHQQMHSILHRASERADALVRSAQEDAQKLRALARTRFLRSARLGYASGRRAALREWNAKFVKDAEKEQEALLRERDRWVHIVVDACARLMHEENPDGLYTRAAQALLRSGGAQAQALQVWVACGEATKARAAFNSILTAHGGPRIEIHESEGVAEGNCRCEWAGGGFETGLEWELDSLRRALHKSAQVQLQHDQTSSVDDPDNASHFAPDCIEACFKPDSNIPSTPACVLQPSAPLHTIRPYGAQNISVSSLANPESLADEDSYPENFMDIDALYPPSISSGTIGAVV